MRRLLAAVVLALFASLNAMDGVCCPDGCTREQQSPAPSHSPEASDGNCMLCLGGVDSSVRPALAPGEVATDGVGPPPPAHHVDAPSDPVEHPPRS